jgi:mannose-6-phosphate isomerase-like protein (cupin superfamily)
MKRMTNRRDALGAMLMMMAAEASAAGDGAHSAWRDTVYNLEGGKTTHAPFGDTTVYFTGKTGQLKDMTAGCLVLKPGQEPHPPHQHPEEEFLLIGEGTGEILVNGKTVQVGPGSLMYSESNHLHGIKNTGSEPMRFYFFKWLG